MMVRRFLSSLLLVSFFCNHIAFAMDDSEAGLRTACASSGSDTSLSSLGEDRMRTASNSELVARPPTPPAAAAAPEDLSPWEKILGAIDLEDLQGFADMLATIAPDDSTEKNRTATTLRTYIANIGAHLATEICKQGGVEEMCVQKMHKSQWKSSPHAGAESSWVKDTVESIFPQLQQTIQTLWTEEKEKSTPTPRSYFLNINVVSFFVDNLNGKIFSVLFEKLLASQICPQLGYLVGWSVHDGLNPIPSLQEKAGDFLPTIRASLVRQRPKHMDNLQALLQKDVMCPATKAHLAQQGIDLKVNPKDLLERIKKEKESVYQKTSYSVVSFFAGENTEDQIHADLEKEEQRLTDVVALQKLLDPAEDRQQEASREFLAELTEMAENLGYPTPTEVLTQCPSIQEGKIYQGMKPLIDQLDGYVGITPALKGLEEEFSDDALSTTYENTFGKNVQSLQALSARMTRTVQAASTTTELCTVRNGLDALNVANTSYKLGRKTVNIFSGKLPLPVKKHIKRVMRKAIALQKKGNLLKNGAATIGRVAAAPTMYVVARTMDAIPLLNYASPLIHFLVKPTLALHMLNASKGITHKVCEAEFQRTGHRKWGIAARAIDTVALSQMALSGISKCVEEGATDWVTLPVLATAGIALGVAEDAVSAFEKADKAPKKNVNAYSHLFSGWAASSAVVGIGVVITCPLSLPLTCAAAAAGGLAAMGSIFSAKWLGKSCREKPTGDPNTDSDEEDEKEA